MREKQSTNNGGRMEGEVTRLAKKTVTRKEGFNLSQQLRKAGRDRKDSGEKKE